MPYPNHPKPLGFEVKQQLERELAPISQYRKRMEASFKSAALYEGPPESHFVERGPYEKQHQEDRRHPCGGCSLVNILAYELSMMARGEKHGKTTQSWYVRVSQAAFLGFGRKFLSAGVPRWTVGPWHCPGFLGQACEGAQGADELEEYVLIFFLIFLEIFCWDSSLKSFLLLALLLGGSSLGPSL